MKKPYNNVKWYINNTCNLNCSFCFVNKVQEETPLDLPTKFKVLDKLFKDGIEYIDFFGKEPLLNEDIFKIMSYGQSKNYPFYYTFISNGKNLKKYTKNLLQSPCRDFTISYDFHSGDREYQFDLKNLLPFKGNFYIELSIDVHKGNIPKIFEYVNYVEDFGVTSLYFNPIISFGNKEVSIISEKDYNSFMINFFNWYRGNCDLTFKIPPQMEYLTKEYKNSNCGHISIEPYCESGINHFCISNGGIAYDCVSQCAIGNNQNTCNYLNTSIEDVYHVLSKHCYKRMCEVVE